MSDVPAQGAAPDQIEVEWQFDAIDLRPVERWLANLPVTSPTAARRPSAGPTDLRAGSPTVLARPPRRLVDHYLDTADWRIARAGFVLRTRSRGRRDEVTLKDTRPPGSGGLRQRLEVSEALPDGGVGALGVGGPVGRRLAPVAGHRAFRQVLEVRTRRRPYTLRVGDDEVAEVALDDTVITAGPGEHPARLRRVEVEVAPAWVKRLEPVVEELRRACGLQPASLSKFEAGLLALGIEVPGPPDLGSTEVSADSTLGDLAFAVVRTHLGVLLAREPGTRLGEDIEELHDMRVATRRLRAAIDLFADALPVRARAMRTELRWVTDVLGRVRDLDVQLDRLGEMEGWALGADGGRSPLDELRQLLEHQRAEARRTLIEALDSPRWERLAGDLVAMAQHGQRRRVASARAAAAVTVPDLVTPRHLAVVKAARRARRSGAPADFHRLRIRCKRLRYSLEFTAGIYGDRTERFTRKLARLQDALGLMQDAEVATNRLLALATGEGSPRKAHELPARTVFAMGAVAERYRAESAALLAKMPKRLGMLNGGEWHALAAHMARRQSAAADLLPSPVPPPASPQPSPHPQPPSPPTTDGPVEATTVALAPAEVPEDRGLPGAAAPAEVPEDLGLPGAPVRAADHDPTPLAVATAAWPDAYWGQPAVNGPNGAPVPGGGAGAGSDPDDQDGDGEAGGSSSPGWGTGEVPGAG